MINTTSISIALAKNNVEWSDNYDNVILFNHDVEILDYLGLSDSDFIQYNFPLFSSTKPRDVVIDLKNENKNVYDIVNSNYLVARLITSDGKTKYYYYFVNSATQSTQTTFVFTLTLDIFTTYKLNVDFTIKNVLTARKHCDRFNRVAPGRLLAFKNTSDSEVMFEDDLESVNQPKELTNIITPVSSATKEVGERLWLYLYISLPTGIKPATRDLDGFYITGDIGSETNLYGLSNFIQRLPEKDIRNNYAVLVAPLYPISVYNVPTKASGSGDWVGSEITWSATYLMKYFSQGISEGGKYLGSFQVYGANISELPPVKLTFDSSGKINYNTNFGTTTDTRNKQIVFVGYQTGEDMSEGYITAPFLLFQNINVSNGDVIHKYQIQIRDRDNHVLNGVFDITPTQVKTNKNILYEPKLYKSAFRNIKIRTNASETFYEFPVLNCLDCSKVNSTAFQMYYLEMPTPEGVIEFSTIVNNSYYKYNFDNFIGIASKNAFTIPITSDAYTNFLQNNKNAMLTGLVMPLVNDTWGMISSTAGSIESLITKNKSKEGGTGGGSSTPFMNFVGGVLDMVNTGLSYYAKMDNLRNKPDNLKYMATNGLEALMIANIEFSPYIEVWEAYENNMQKAYDLYYVLGYKVNKITSSDERNNRYYFNFVQTGENCESKIISKIPLSLEIKRLISNALLKGITFWNYTEQFAYLDYSMENWENSLFL